MSSVQSLVEFERRCEFSVTRWTHDRCVKINKILTVCNGVKSFILWYLDCKFGSVTYPGHPNKLTELYLWRFKLGISLSRLPCRHLTKPDIQKRTFQILEIKKKKKNQNLLDIQKQCICKLGKIQSELRLLFGVYYWFLKLYTRIVWHSYFPSHGIL